MLLTRPPSAFAGAVPLKVIELDNLVVRADLRGRGVGRRLIEAIVDWSRGQGATHVDVAVHAFNRDARRFYENRLRPVDRQAGAGGPCRLLG